MPIETLSSEEIEEMEADLDFIEQNNIQAESQVEDFRSAINFIRTFPSRPIAVKVCRTLRERIRSLKPVELELVTTSPEAAAA